MSDYGYEVEIAEWRERALSAERRADDLEAEITVETMRHERAIAERDRERELTENTRAELRRWESGELLARKATVMLLERQELDTVTKITEWLDAWTPTIGETEELNGRVWQDLLQRHKSTLVNLYFDDVSLSFDDTCLLVIAAIRAGLWKK